MNQQQAPPPQYGAPYRSGPGSYGAPPNQFGQQQQQPPPQPGNGQLQPYQPQQESGGFSGFLDGIKGFGERARTTVEQTRETVMQKANEVTENVSTQSSGKYTTYISLCKYKCTWKTIQS